MSLLAKVLDSVEKAELEKLHNIPKLLEQLNKIKDDTVLYLDKCQQYLQIFPRSNQEMLRTLQKLDLEVRELNNFKGKCRKSDLEQANMNAEQVWDQLNQINDCIQFLVGVYQTNENLLLVQSKLGTQDYANCIALIDETISVINSLPKDENAGQINYMHILVQEFKQTKLMETLNESLNGSIDLTSMDNQVRLSVRTDSEKLCELIAPQSNANTEFWRLNFMGTFLLAEIFTKIATCSVSVNVTSDGSFNVLHLDILGQTPDQYQKLFENIETVCVFLKENFNHQLTEKLTILEYIGQDIQIGLAKIIKSLTTKETEKILNILQQYSLATTENNTSNNFQINEKYCMFQAQMDTIVKKDLSTMKVVGHDLNDNASKEVFPQCAVSLSAIEFVELLKSTSPMDIVQQDAIPHYGTMVVTYHKKQLDLIPQQVALFYNNCKYIVFEMDKWVLTTQSNALLGHDSTPLDQFAIHLFTKCVDQQIREINSIMKEDNLKDFNCETSLNKTLLLLNELKEAWLNILPSHFYNTTMGMLLNTVCNFLINLVLNCAIIDQNVAQEMRNSLQIVINEGLKLFTQPKEIVCARNWSKLIELEFVLGWNSVEIEDQRSQGFFQQCTSKDLEILLGALFEDTKEKFTLL